MQKQKQGTFESVYNDFKRRSLPAERAGITAAARQRALHF